MAAGLVTSLGFVAGIFTTMSTLPEIYKTLKMREARDLSMDWLLLGTAGTAMWAVYGFFIDSGPVLVMNAISLVFLMGLILIKLKYR